MHPPEGIIELRQLVDQALADAMYATRAAMHGTLKATPGSIAFD